MTKGQSAIIEEIATLLKYHVSCGISFYPATEDIGAFFDIAYTPVSGKPPSDLAELATPGPVAAQANATDVVARQSQASRGDIEEEVGGCRACGLAEKRIRPVAGYGGEKVRLLIVGDWLAAPVDQSLPATSLFGIAQDQMLDRMLAAINMPKEHIFVTNVIKCVVPANCQPLAEHVRCCLSYLLRQIVILRPEVICTMGTIAAKSLLKRPEPLSRLRGRVHCCRADDGRQIPLLPTYHPTYLLQNPEMKQATWADLQLLGRHLGTIPINAG